MVRRGRGRWWACSRGSSWLFPKLQSKFGSEALLDASRAGPMESAASAPHLPPPLGPPLDHRRHPASRSTPVRRSKGHEPRIDESNHKPSRSRRPASHLPAMSYYFVIVGTQDNPLFEHEFGTSKQGGDGAAHFADQARSMNQFVVHSSLDVLEEVQWSTGQMCVPFVSLRPYFRQKLHFPEAQQALTSCPQVPQAHRPLLQQLHLRLRDPHQRKVPPSPPARRPHGALGARLVLHRREPHLARHRGGRPQLLRRGPRELGQGRHEPLLPRRHGGVEPRLQGEGRRRREEVSVGAGLHWEMLGEAMRSRGV